MNRIEKDPFQTGIEITNWLVLLSLFGLGTLVFSWQFALSILVGGFISIINFHWLYRDLSRMFIKLASLRPSPKISSVVISFFIRFGVTAVVLYLLFTSGAFDVIGVVVGLSVVVLNLFLATARLILKKNRFEEAQ